MPKAAVASETVPDSELNTQLNNLRRQLGYGRGLRPNRGQLLLIGLVIVGFWLVIVFGRALTQLNEATQREAVMAAETQTLQLQLEAERRELRLVQTDGFQALQARALGYGESGEQVFSLPAGAPSAPRVVPLGAQSAPTSAQTPFEAWLDLFFGN